MFRVIDRIDARGKAYFWIGVEPRRVKPPKGSDLWAVACNFISVTPLCLDYTHQPTREMLATRLFETSLAEADD